MSTKAEDTQKNILDTARKHFLKDGLTGASLRNIVKDAPRTHHTARAWAAPAEKYARHPPARP